MGTGRGALKLAIFSLCNVSMAASVVFNIIMLICRCMWYVDVKFAGGERMWMFLTVFVAAPGIAWCYINAQRIMAEEHHHPRQEFVPYTHLRLRSKVIYRKKYHFVLFTLSFTVAVFFAIFPAFCLYVSTNVL